MKCKRFENRGPFVVENLEPPILLKDRTVLIVGTPQQGKNDCEKSLPCALQQNTAYTVGVRFHWMRKVYRWLSKLWSLLGYHKY